MDENAVLEFSRPKKPSRHELRVKWDGPTLRLDFLHARHAVETLLFHEALELDANDKGFVSS